MTKTKILPIARKIFKNAEKNGRDLSGCFNLNNKYYITDGYRGIRLDEDYTIPILTDNNRKSLFETVEKFFNEDIDVVNRDCELSLPSLDTLKEMKKSIGRYEFGDSRNSPMVNIEYLTDMLKLGMNQAWYNINNRSIYFRAKDGTDAVLMTIRK